MVELAAIEPGHTVLEPSAGTGRILRAIREATGGAALRTAVEISACLCDHLRVSESGADVVNTDFLTYEAPAPFDRILMNPPFSHGDDIRHIRHALEMLKPGGRLVAVCANGPRQREALQPLVAAHGGEWVDLPADTFAESGTSVNTALMILTA
ncbi:methyltransferase [Burkholderia contaminans]|uniref:methyltransferase n=1 Tax=Burkholderia contaminans TaxID=488447 RepID=UPI003AB99B2A